MHRTTHGLSLTEEGEAVAAHGAQMLAVAAQLDADLDDRRGEPSGLVRIATSAVIGQFLLPALAPLLERHARLRIEIAADDRIVDMAREGIDIAGRTDNTAIALAMALEGLAIARLNATFAERHVAEGRLVPVLDEWIERVRNPIYAVMLPERQRLPKVRVCVDRLADWFSLTTIPSA